MIHNPYYYRTRRTQLRVEMQQFAAAAGVLVEEPAEYCCFKVRLFISEGWKSCFVLVYACPSILRDIVLAVLPLRLCTGTRVARRHGHEESTAKFSLSIHYPALLGRNHATQRGTDFMK
jgi:hypothetical protein